MTGVLDSLGDPHTLIRRGTTWLHRNGWGIKPALGFSAVQPTCAQHRHKHGDFPLCFSQWHNPHRHQSAKAQWLNDQLRTKEGNLQRVCYISHLSSAQPVHPSPAHVELPAMSLGVLHIQKSPVKPRSSWSKEILLHSAGAGTCHSCTKVSLCSNNGTHFVSQTRIK